jgi:antitoxin component YwqK of YwqJK toxin-antitoxin module
MGTVRSAKLLISLCAVLRLQLTRLVLIFHFSFLISHLHAQDTLFLYGDTIRVGSLEWDMQKDWRAKGVRIAENRELYGDHVRILLRYHRNRVVAEIVFGYINKEEGFVHHGPARYYYETGQLLSKRKFVEGSLQGVSEDFYPDGKLMVRAAVKDDLLHGTYESFYPTGTREIVCWYEMDSLHGTFRSWYSNGQLRRIEHWDHDKKVGTDSTFYENGKLESTLPYENDELHGIAKVYHRTGRQWTEWLYDHGRLWDIAFTQSKEGNPLEVGGFQNGLGWVNIYNDNGILIERDFYKDGYWRKTKKVRE